jgi:hypothetical protein
MEAGRTGECGRPSTIDDVILVPAPVKVMSRIESRYGTPLRLTVPQPAGRHGASSSPWVVSPPL